VIFRMTFKGVFYWTLSSGDVYCWKDHDFQRLLRHGSSGSNDPEQYPAPCPVRCLSDMKVIKISASGNLAAAVTRAGQVFTW